MRTPSTRWPARCASACSPRRAATRATATCRSASARSSSARRACSTTLPARGSAARIAERSFGLGPLEPLLGDPAVDEIMVNGPGQVWVERGGRIEPTGVSFAGEAELRHAIERILAPLGRRVDEAEPLCDARLPDGSRVNVVVAPLALDGPVLTIRRFRPRGFGPDDLVANGTWAAPLQRPARRAPCARAATCSSAAAPARARRRRSTR